MKTDKQKAKDLIIKEVFTGKSHEEAVTKAAIEGAKDQDRLLDKTAIQESIKTLSAERENILKTMERNRSVSAVYEVRVEESLERINEQIDILISKL